MGGLAVGVAGDGAHRRGSGVAPVRAGGAAASPGSPAYWGAHSALEAGWDAKFWGAKFWGAKFWGTGAWQ